MAQLLTGDAGALSVRASELLHGCICVSREGEGWIRPHRFADEQVRAIGSCQAWHPGLYRQMARTTSGVTLEFETDASTVVLEIMVDSEPAGTQAVLERIDGASERQPHDGVSAKVDERALPCSMPAVGETTLTFELEGTELVEVGQMACLPGFGATHHMVIYLPALRGCVIRNLMCDGSFVTPVDVRPQLLALGDSITQGFVTEDPATSWPMLLASRLGLDLVNQSLGGQVFQPGTLYGLAHGIDPEVIVIAFGENYRYEPCTQRSVARDVRAYLADVARIWPGVPTFVLTPFHHDETLSPSHGMSCWARVPAMIAANVATHGEMRLVEGSHLLDGRLVLLADADGHPNEAGARQIAERLHVRMLVERGDPTERRMRAVELLKDAPLRAFPLLEAARRGIGEVVVAEEGCVLVNIDDGQQLLYAPDRELGRSVAAVLVHDEEPLVAVCEPALVRDVQHLYGLKEILPYHLAIYEEGTPIPVDAAKDVRVIDETYLETVLAHYTRSDQADDEWVAQALAEGKFLGGFDGDELVGFIGEHPEGSMGMLEVFEGHRRKGWAHALEATKINQALSSGQVPWGQVFPHNRISLALQRSLNLTVTPANEQCYVY